MIRLAYRKRNRSIPTPKYAHDGDSGFDLAAAFLDGPKWLHPGEVMIVPTGLFFAIPYGFEGQVRPRSGMAIKNGITVINTPGTIDSTYRGELKVGLVNHSTDRRLINNGDRVAQMVIAPVEYVVLTTRKEMGNTKRGDGGFGSTGTHSTVADRGRD